MPRKKTAPRKKYSKPKSKTGLALYLLIAACLFVIIFLLSQPGSGLRIPGFKNRAPAQIDSVVSIPPSQKVSPPGQNVEKPVGETQAATERGIVSALAKLQISPMDIKRKQKDNEVTYLVPIDPNDNDLTFANMIIKGEVEQMKGEFVSGIQKGRRQILTFLDKTSGQNYIVELFYQSKEETIKPTSRAICIIVDDFGNSKGSLLTGFAKTNPAVCFAILPQTPYADDAMKIATQYRHESIIHVPMEPVNYPRENPGDNAIFIQQTAGEINRRLERFIRKLPDCIGISNHMGSLATAVEPPMQTVMQTLRKHNLMFVDSRTSGNSLAYKIAQKNLVPAFKRDIFLDEPDLTDANLDKKIAECVNLSQTKAYIIAIMHCHTDKHLSYLNSFITKAQQQGFELVPLSRLGAYKLPEIR
jgi:polysaccharide deacetylase 2 family uncharacterized protein YibQ